MSTPYVGEIRMGGWNFAPVGWALCQGQLLPIAEYNVLFAVIGTNYGGDGQTTFALPDLRGRVPAHQGNGWVLGYPGGVEQVTLTASQLPQHSHPFTAALNPGTQKDPAGNVIATLSGEAESAYLEEPPTAALAAASIGASAGGSQPHDNMQPYLGLTFIISLFGVYPSQG